LLHLAGRALVVRCSNDFLPVLQALHDAPAGPILGVNAGASTGAMAGEWFASEAVRKEARATSPRPSPRGRPFLAGIDQLWEPR
jgi:hypothetical protein